MPSSAVQTCADRKSTRLNSSHTIISYAVFCLKKKHASSSAPLLLTFPPSPHSPNPQRHTRVRAALRVTPTRRPPASASPGCSFFFFFIVGGTPGPPTFPLPPALPI